MSIDDTEDASNVDSSNSDDAAHEHENSLSFMWRMLLGTIRKGFPDAKQLRTEKLAAWLDDSDSKKSILLLDVREKDEFAVSTIEGSVNTNPDGSDKELIFQKIHDNSDDLPDKIKKIVFFCSVGYRSAKLAQNLKNKLEKEGEVDKFDVFNLEGSLFKWANERRTMIDSHGNSTTFCHPYNTIWGKFLECSLRKYTP